MPCHLSRILPISRFAIVVAWRPLVLEWPQERPDACNGRRHDSISHVPLCCDDILKGNGRAKKVSVEVVQTNSGDCYHRQSSRECEYDQELCFHAHLQCPDHLHRDAEDEQLSSQVKRTNGLPFGPLHY